MAGKKKYKKTATTSSESGESDRERLKESTDSGGLKHKKNKRKHSKNSQRRTNSMTSPTGSGSLPMRALVDDDKDNDNEQVVPMTNGSEKDVILYTTDSYQLGAGSYGNENRYQSPIEDDRSPSDLGGFQSPDLSYTNCIGDELPQLRSCQPRKSHISIQDLIARGNLRHRGAGGKGRELLNRKKDHNQEEDPDDDSSSFFAKVGTSCDIVKLLCTYEW